MAYAKFQENRFKIDREIAENHAILVNLTAPIITPVHVWRLRVIGPCDKLTIWPHQVKVRPLV